MKKNERHPSVVITRSPQPGRWALIVSVNGVLLLYKIYSSRAAARRGYERWSAELRWQLSLMPW